MSAEPAGHRLLPWLRTGLAAELPAGGTGDGGRATLPVALGLREGAGPPQDLPPLTVRLQGPGDVVGLDPRQVIRTEPSADTHAFEWNLFPAVELDAPELPWLFTPDPTPPAGEAGRLRPWLCLVVVRRERASLDTAAGRPLPVLRLDAADAALELPDLAESWAWAHVQLAGATGTVAAALAGPPERTLARLLCPRRLETSSAYLACLVPAFLAGRQAGLGLEVGAGAEPAWPPYALDAAASCELPVYFHWEFETGAGGDFEALVRRLEPRELGDEVGGLPVDMTAPGAGLPAAPGAPGSTLAFEGALRAPRSAPGAWPDPPREAFRARLAELLDGPAASGDGVLAPPLYGGVHPGAARVGTAAPDAAAEPPRWLRELNLDPRLRAAAALGAQVVQERQEQLMASAWDQFGALERAAQLARQAQLSRAVASSMYARRLGALAPETVLRVTGPLHARVRVSAAGGPSASETLRATIRRSHLPEAAVSAPFRRALRPGGPLARRLPSAPGTEPAAQVVRGLADRSLEVRLARQRDGAVEFDAVAEQRLATLRSELPTAAGWRLVDDFRRRPPAVLATGDAALTRRTAADGGPATSAGTAAPPRRARAALAQSTLVRVDLPDDVGEELSLRRERLSGINARFREAAAELEAYLGPGAPPAPAAAPLPLDVASRTLVERGGQLDPERSVPARLQARVSGTPPAGADPLSPPSPAPSYPQPMSGPLRELSREALLPGAEHIPPESVALLEANARFIEAYMVGLNHELSRELLWRGFPGDRRATFFRQFWDVRGRDTATPAPATDIPPIADWDPRGALGDNATRVGGDGMLVLLVRGELLRRYPRATVYAVEAATRRTLGTRELFPEFRGALEPDLAFLGFGLSAADARGTPGGHPGWFFVIQEQPTELRFGLDAVPHDLPEAGFGGAPGGWGALSWSQLVTSRAALEALSHLPVETPALNPALSGLTLEGATWGLNAAHMAQITLRRPVRVAIHAEAMLRDAGDAAGPG